MPQIDFIRETVSDFFDALEDSDLADTGTYTPPGLGATPTAGCRGLINRGIATLDGASFGRAVGTSITVRLVLSDLPSPPKRGATWSVESQTFGVETFELVQWLADDGALSIWQVKNA
jgi:hypothetical protein